jgi:oxygen-independent coproporphyrinogen-3 oxidase
MFERYVSRICGEIASAHEIAGQMGGSFRRSADSIYFGGGTPTLLTVELLEPIFVTIRQNFKLHPQAEITVECAPGTLSDQTLGALVRNGVNRVSLGVQSFVDQEARSVGRLHNRAAVLQDVTRLRAAGIGNINVDLIAGLPHQTRESWEQSLGELIATGVPHASVYMLEIDEDSRLGRELIAGGRKYHAHFVPDEDLTADLYEIACQRLNAAGIEQYEISNFARVGFESHHNLKYWTRRPYLGFGLDAHSMLFNVKVDPQRNPEAQPEQQRAKVEFEDSAEHTNSGGGDNRVGRKFHSFRTHPKSIGGTAVSRVLPDAIRFCNPDDLESYLSASHIQQTIVSSNSALQEACFLGLRLIKGIDLQNIAAQFGKAATAELLAAIIECEEMGLVEQEGDSVRLTPKGRLLSNEVFQKFIALEPVGH